MGKIGLKFWIMKILEGGIWKELDCGWECRKEVMEHKQAKLADLRRRISHGFGFEALEWKV